MIRNILYSLFLHSILFILVYFSFNFVEPQEIEKTSKVAISFIVRAGNSENTISQAPPEKQAKSQPKPIEKPKPQTKPKPAPKKVVKKTKPKPKPAPKKPNAKQELKFSKPKTEEKKPDINLAKEPKKEPDEKQSPEKPKTEEKKPEVKEEVKKEEKPKIEDEPEDQNDKDQEEFDEETLPDNATTIQSFDSKKLESLDLLVREKFNIHNQITRCYQKALAENGGKNKSVVNAHIIIAEDGYINPNSIVIKNFEKYNDPKEKDFHQAVDIVKQALQYCSPLRNLPVDKYEIWRELDLEFNGSD